MRVALVLTLAAAVHGSLLDCTYSPVTLPVYAPTGDYLVLYLDTKPIPVIITSADTTHETTSVFSSSSTSPVYTQVGFSACDSWSIRIDIEYDVRRNVFDADEAYRLGFREFQYVRVHGWFGPQRIDSLHALSSRIPLLTDNTSTLCDDLIGKRMHENAPILVTEQQYYPVDLLLQGPTAVAVLSMTRKNHPVITAVACPYTVSVPTGKAVYIDGTTNITFQTVLHGDDTIPVTRLDAVIYNGVHTIYYTDDDYAPRISDSNRSQPPPECQGARRRFPFRCRPPATFLAIMSPTMDTPPHRVPAPPLSSPRILTGWPPVLFRALASR
jgi:hypothetical protein